jgi:hypothetical protein
VKSAVRIVADSGGRPVEHLGAQRCQLPVPGGPFVFDDVFKRSRKIWNNEFVLFVSVCPSVRFTVWKNSALSGIISVKFRVGDFWYYMSRKFNFAENWTKCHED